MFVLWGRPAEADSARHENRPRCLLSRAGSVQRLGPADWRQSVLRVSVRARVGGRRRRAAWTDGALDERVVRSTPVLAPSASTDALTVASPSALSGALSVAGTWMLRLAANAAGETLAAGKSGDWPCSMR